MRFSSTSPSSSGRSGSSISFSICSSWVSCVARRSTGIRLCRSSFRRGTRSARSSALCARLLAQDYPGIRSDRRQRSLQRLDRGDPRRNRGARGAARRGAWRRAAARLARQTVGAASGQSARARRAAAVRRRRCALRAGRCVGCGAAQRGDASGPDFPLPEFRDARPLGERA